MAEKQGISLKIRLSAEEPTASKAITHRSNMVHKMFNRWSEIGQRQVVKEPESKRIDRDVLYNYTEFWLVCSTFILEILIKKKQ